MKVKDILKWKGPQVFTIGEEISLKTAMDFLANNRIGVLLVLTDDGKLSGIISERDIIRVAAESLDNILTKTVGDVMTRQIIVVEPEDELEYVESIMTRNRIRHLPVLNAKRLVGLISIGDTVKTSLTEVRTENKYLLDYIGGNLA